MQLNEAIQHLRESLADPTHEWGCEECKAEHEQLLKWLEDYKQIKSERCWIPCKDKLPKERVYVLFAVDGTVQHGFYSGVAWHTRRKAYAIRSVTHWMYAPLPPKGDNNAE